MYWTINWTNEAAYQNAEDQLSAAMEKHYRSDNPNIAVVKDPLAELIDLVSFNQYIGWYDGLPEKAQRVP